VPAPRGAAPVPTTVGAPRRPAWAESAARLRAAATTEPGRLRIIGGVLALLVLAFGAVTAWQVNDRATAADNVVTHSAPLSATAAEIYRSLADADAAVTGGFLVGGEQPEAVAAQYAKDIDTASRLIAEASANSQGSPQARVQIANLSKRLPQYVELIATALANNRQGLPIGGAYLRYANTQMNMQGGLLKSAKELYRIENTRLADDYRVAKALPWISWTLGALVLLALAWAQRRHYRRTNRVFNRGMLAATGACALVLLWLVAGHTVSRTELANSSKHGASSIQVLNNARILVLNARGDENLTLVARGAGDNYEKSYTAGMAALAGKDPKGVGGDLAKALELANDKAGRAPVNAAIDAVKTWRGRHATERANDKKGNYDTAVAEVIGGKDSGGRTVPQEATTGANFHAADDALRVALGHEQDEFRHTAETGRDALTLLPAGAAVLAVLGAAAAVLGVSRRLSEYR
jgi:hypothetical protein